jgi:hypothetical protein
VSCRRVEAGGLFYRFCPDDPARAADRPRAVVSGVVRDEITREAPETEIAVTSAHPALTPRVASGGVMGLVGNPGRLFPGLDAASVALELSVAAPGYLPRSLRATLGPIAGFPDSFVPANLGVVALHRAPVVLRGRVVRRAGLGGIPLAGVSVSIAAAWRTFPPHDVDPDTVIEAAHLVSLHPGLYAPRSSPADGLRRRDMVLAAGQEKTLLAAAGPGDRTVRLSDRVGLSAGNVLAIEPGAPDRAETIRVTAVVGASTDDQPAVVTLAHPLALEHRALAVCVRATPQPPGAGNPLSYGGTAGDRVTFVASLAGVASGAVVELSGGPAAAEYQAASLYRAVSDPDGYYRLPPISRLASVRIRAERADLPAPRQVVVSLDYGRFENRVDLIFP